MKINASKTKEIIRFGKGAESVPKISINECEVWVDHTKVLGVTLSSDLTGNLHIDGIVSKASKRFWFGLSEGFTPCRQLRPSSRREHVKASKSQMGWGKTIKRLIKVCTAQLLSKTLKSLPV